MNQALFSAVQTVNADHAIFDGEPQPEPVSYAATDDACQTELTEEECGRALERAHLATERHLHAWLITGTERHLELAKAHIDQLIALGRIHQRSNA